jgi:hypothetical protein
MDSNFGIALSLFGFFELSAVSYQLVNERGIELFSIAVLLTANG